MTNESVEEVGRKVRDHFHDDADRFDSIYRKEKGLFARFVDDIAPQITW